MMSKYRLANGGRIDRSRPVTFTFDGRGYQGYVGDTLASALLANGVHLAGRSFKYHRPRGIYSAGIEEPNALVEVLKSGTIEPNTRATVSEIYDGFQAQSQNCWPSLKFDIMAVNSRFSALLSAGFYYKTFMWPRKGWMFYERFIRQAAGMGRASNSPDWSRYDKAHLHCDILVIGGGPAGLVAALEAAESGADVVLVEQDVELGGQALSETGLMAGQDLQAWLAKTVSAVTDHPNIRVLTRTCAFGDYDGKTVGMVERVSDHLPTPTSGLPVQRYWTACADQIIHATGAIERPFVFGNNDLPGIMLASAASAYVQRYATRPGNRTVIFTNNDGVYAQLPILHAAGIEITAVVDCRAEVPDAVQAVAKNAGATLYTGHAITEARGRLRVKSARIASLDGDQIAGAETEIPCDLLLVSAGWSPVVHLTSHRGSKPIYNETLNAFLPGKLDAGYYCCGSMLGHWSVDAAVADGRRVARLAAEATPGDLLPANIDAIALHPLWEVPSPKGRKLKKFVDLQHDVTASDLHLAHREGFISVEHMKRYTTLGMATDQGKTSNMSGLAIMAADRRVPLTEVGTTTFRPPYTPVSIGALANHSRGQHFQPRRQTPMRAADEAKGAPMNRIGLWERAWYYPATSGETLDAAYKREAAHVRQHVGMCDISSLGKIDVQGPDAAEFLNRVYSNAWLKLPVGKCRYGLMLREDGIVMDDGTTARYGAQDYFMTTTTSNAGKIMTHLEFLLDTQWPDLRVNVTSVTDQWAGMSLAGPKSRAVLQAVLDDIDLSETALPHMGARKGHLQGYPVRVNRLSFSGELAYEVFTPAGYGAAVWTILGQAGGAYDLCFYGTEALGALRIEKGHVSGPELDGRTTAKDLGLGGLASSKKPYIGSVMQHREGLTDPNRPSLIGLKPVDRQQKVVGGSLLLAKGADLSGHGEGHVTSTTYSPALGHHIALGFLIGGQCRIGEHVSAVNLADGRTIDVEIVSPHFYDPEGDRLHA